jgi:hypothetical protein
MNGFPVLTQPFPVGANEDMQRTNLLFVLRAVLCAVLLMANIYDNCPYRESVQLRSNSGKILQAPSDARTDIHRRHFLC